MPDYYATTLARYLLEPLVDRRRKGEFIQFGPYMAVGIQLFEQGAFLGHAYRHRFAEFVAPLWMEKPEAATIVLAKGAEIDAKTLTAGNLTELLMTFEMLKVDAFAELSSWSGWFRSHAADDFQAEVGFLTGEMFVPMGAGFAALRPERFEDLYSLSYRPEHFDRWTQAYALGVVDSPEPPPFVPFAERRAAAAHEFLDYWRQFFRASVAVLEGVA